MNALDDIIKSFIAFALPLPAEEHSASRPLRLPTIELLSAQLADLLHPLPLQKRARTRSCCRRSSCCWTRPRRRRARSTPRSSATSSPSRPSRPRPSETRRRRSRPTPGRRSRRRSGSPSSASRRPARPRCARRRPQSRSRASPERAALHSPAGAVPTSPPQDLNERNLMTPSCLAHACALCDDPVLRARDRRDVALGATHRRRTAAALELLSFCPSPDASFNELSPIPTRPCPTPLALSLLSFSLSRPLVTMDAVQLLPLLSQSLSSDPATRRQSERQLAQHESAPGFLISVLAIVQGAGEAPMEIRLAAGIYFKNAVRKMWAEVRRLLALRGERASSTGGVGARPRWWRSCRNASGRGALSRARKAAR